MPTQAWDMALGGILQVRSIVRAVAAGQPRAWIHMPGVKTSYVKDGMTVTLLDGVLHSEIPVGDTGTARYYHRNGAVAAEVPLKHGRTHGISRKWHDNGQLKSETDYVYGMVVGVSRTWEPDGSLLMESNYVVPDLDGSLAVHGRIYADKGHVHSVYLWNGTELSKARWTKKVLATGMTESELAQKLAAGQTAQPPGGA